MTETLLLDRARHRLFHDRRLFDPAFTIYVWFDALLNYITGIGYGSPGLAPAVSVSFARALNEDGLFAS